MPQVNSLNCWCSETDFYSHCFSLKTLWWTDIWENHLLNAHISAKLIVRKLEISIVAFVFFTSLHKTLCLHLIETIHIHTRDIQLYTLSSNGSTIYIPLKAWVQNITSFTVYVYTSTDIILFLPWQWAKPFFVINCCTQRIYVVKAISRSADLSLWSYI